MDHPAARSFFLQPACPCHRQYEALRAVFVEGLSQREAAQRFGYSYDAFRHLAAQFRAALDAGQAPPFSPGSAAAARPARLRRPRRARTSPPSPTRGR